MSRVSVIIPSYNCAAFVANAVDSVLGQTMQDYEVIVVDDGSTDNTREVLRRYLEHPRFRYLFQSNRGVSAAKNLGARASDAEYVAFLDADDTLAPEALELATAALDESGASWCLINIYKVNGERREVQRTNLPSEDPFYGILKEDFIRRGIFFRRTGFRNVGMFDEGLRTREDWDIGIRIFRLGMPFVYLNQPLCTYVWREGSLTTGNQSRLLADTEKVLRKHHKALADAGDRRVAKIYAHNMWDLGRRYFYIVGDYRRAFACMRESLAYDLNPGRMFHPLVHHLRRFLRCV